MAVRFDCSAPTREPDGEEGDLAAPGLATVAERLRQAAALGDFSEVQAIPQHLIRGSPGDARLGRRIARLASEFEFEALGRLAGPEEPHDPTG